MADELRIVALDERDRWIEEHARDGLPSQSWGYASALSASGVEPRLAVVEEGGARMLMVFHEREWSGTTDIATILGLSGVSISPPSSAPLSAWKEYAASQGWVAGYLQLAPTMAPVDPPSEDKLLTSNAVFLLELVDRDILESASRIVRRKVRLADACGLKLERDPMVVADALKALYPAAHQRRGGSALYDFNPSTLERWALDENSVALGGRRGDVVETVSVSYLSGSTAEYHISAGTESARDFDAWLLWQASEALRARGVEVLNLGGGVRPGDGIYEFKARFNGVLAPLKGLRQIYDRERFIELCRAAGVLPDGPRFPPYRTSR
jgi:hypothetical protein